MAFFLLFCDKSLYFSGVKYLFLLRILDCRYISLMAKSKSKLSPNRASKKTSPSQQQHAPISQDVLQVFKESFDSFDQLSADEKISLYGDAEYLQQFWKHFAFHHPDLLDRVKEKDLPIYLQALEKS